MLWRKPNSPVEDCEFTHTCQKAKSLACCTNGPWLLPALRSLNLRFTPTSTHSTLLVKLFSFSSFLGWFLFGLLTLSSQSARLALLRRGELQPGAHMRALVVCFTFPGDMGLATTEYGTKLSPERPGCKFHSTVKHNLGSVILLLFTELSLHVVGSTEWDLHLLDYFPELLGGEEEYL